MFKIQTFSTSYDYSSSSFLPLSNVNVYIDTHFIDGYTPICICGIRIDEDYDTSQCGISMFGIYEENTFVANIYSLDGEENVAGTVTMQILYIKNAELNGYITGILEDF